MAGDETGVDEPLGGAPGADAEKQSAAGDWPSGAVEDVDDTVDAEGYVGTYRTLAQYVLPNSLRFPPFALHTCGWRDIFARE